MASLDPQAEIVPTRRKTYGKVKMNLYIPTNT